jgi:integrase
MSIERVPRKRSRPAWRVRWYDEAGRRHSRTFRRKEDADAFEAKTKLVRRRGDLAELDAGREKLAVFMDEWWHTYARPRLAASTLAHYERLRDSHIVPRLGRHELRQLRPQLIQRFAADLAAQGVGQETIRKTLVLLQGVLERAVEWGRIQVNPVKVIRKPRQGRKRTIRALPPSTVEQLRERLRVRDAALVSVLAYAGLRPGEALALTWGDIGQQTILVERAAALGEQKETKTRRKRSVRLLKPLASDLAEWRMASGRPDERHVIFPMRDGRLWTESAYRNWRRKVFMPAAKTVGIETPRPYDLRHSFASLMFQEGNNPAEIAEQLGHSLQTLLGTYTHVIDELRGQPRRSAEDLIREARDSHRPQIAPAEASAGEQREP